MFQTTLVHSGLGITIHIVVGLWCGTFILTVLIWHNLLHIWVLHVGMIRRICAVHVIIDKRVLRNDIYLFLWSFDLLELWYLGVLVKKKISFKRFMFTKWRILVYVCTQVCDLKIFNDLHIDSKKYEWRRWNDSFLLLQKSVKN